MQSFRPINGILRINAATKLPRTTKLYSISKKESQSKTIFSKYNFCLSHRWCLTEVLSCKVVSNSLKQAFQTSNHSHFRTGHQRFWAFLSKIIFNPILFISLKIFPQNMHFNKMKKTLVTPINWSLKNSSRKLFILPLH